MRARLFFCYKLRLTDASMPHVLCPLIHPHGCLSYLSWHALVASACLMRVCVQVAAVLERYQGMVVECHLSHNNITNTGANLLLVKVQRPPHPILANCLPRSDDDDCCDLLA
jgi:hypothetical protein